jgi:hypothetical protein
VAQTFIMHTDNTLQVNHIDGNKTNNRIDNLEWITELENIRHRFNVLHKSGWKSNEKRGAYFNREKQKCTAHIKINNKTHWIGNYDTKEEAYDAYFNAFVQNKGYEPWSISNE